MNKIFLIFSVILIGNNANLEKKNSLEYKLSRIDSSGQAFFLYLKRKNILYKVVSLKSASCSGIPLVVGKCYKVDLVEFEDFMQQHDSTWQNVANAYDVQCYSLYNDDSTSICREASCGYKLYSTEAFCGNKLVKVK